MKSFVRAFFLLLVLLTIIYSVRGLEMTEIMSNPEGSDAGYEWIEVQGCADLSAYKFWENGVNHNMNLFLEKNSVTDECISIICDDCTKISALYNLSGMDIRSFDVYDSSFSLNNNGEVLKLMDGLIVVDEINYSVYLPIEEGLSLQKINGSWIGANHTFGMMNIIEEMLIDNTINNVTTDNDTININDTDDGDIEENCTSTGNTTSVENNTSVDVNNTIISEYNNTGGYNHTTEYNNTIGNETMENDITINNTIEDNDTILHNNTIVQNNTIIPNSTTEENSSGDSPTENLSSECYADIGIEVSGERVFKNKEQIKFYNKIYSITDGYNNTLEDKTFIIEYWIEDLAGEIIKKPMNTTNTNQKTYTINIKEFDRVLVIKNRVYIDCLKNITESEKMIIARNDDFEETECEEEDIGSEEGNTDAENPGGFRTSYITLSENNGKALVEIYRGETRKYSVDIKIDGNKQFSHNIKLDKGSRVIASYLLPESPCGSRMIVEGMDLKEEMEIECRLEEEKAVDSPKKSSEKTSMNTSESILSVQMPELKKFNYTNETKQAVYESSAKQNKTYIIAGLTATAALTSFILLTKGSLKEFLNKQ